jgi:hypothetical protein
VVAHDDPDSQLRVVPPLGLTCTTISYVSSTGVAPSIIASNALSELVAGPADITPRVVIGADPGSLYTLTLRLSPPIELVTFASDGVLVPEICFGTTLPTP